MDFWDWLAHASDSLGVLTVVFSGYAALRLYRQNKRLKEVAKLMSPIEDFQALVKAHEGVKSSNPVAFAVSLVRGGATVKNSVETFLKHQRWKMPIVEFNMDGIAGVNDMERLVNQLTTKKREFEAIGYTEMHLFLAGPMPACVQIGAIFDNWLPVKLYHKPQTPPPQVYEYWMPITK